MDLNIDLYIDLVSQLLYVYVYTSLSIYFALNIVS